MQELPKALFPLPPITVVTGHYGVGKTNFSLNLALDAANRGQQVTLIDLDLVNPYFRSSDYRFPLKEQGVGMITPIFAGSTIDVPALSGTIEPAIDAASNEAPVIFDVGGDDVGATALGRFATRIKAKEFQMLYVVNRLRVLTQTPAECTELLAQIETASRLKATALVNNSHLQNETTAEIITAAYGFADEVSRLTGLPLIATTASEELADSLVRKHKLPASGELYPITVRVKPPWAE